MPGVTEQEVNTVCPEGVAGDDLVEKRLPRVEGIARLVLVAVLDAVGTSMTSSGSMGGRVAFRMAAISE